MATIEKYETSTGAAFYAVRYRTPDRRTTRKRGFKTKRDAQAWADQLEVDKRQGVYVAPAAGRITLGEFSREWLESKHKLKPSTRARYRIIVEGELAKHGRIPLGDITRRWVREWVADLSVDLAPASVHKTVGVLRMVLAMAVAENRLAINPADGVELPTVQAVEQRFLTLEQLHALAEAAGEHRALVYVLGTCGIRFGECAELRWKDCALDALKIQVNRSVALVDGEFEIGPPKGGKSRTVALPAFVADLFPGAGKKDALVFPDSQGGHMRGTNVRRRWWADAIAQADIYPTVVRNAAGEDETVYDFKLHELRHTAASLAIQSGANIKSVQNMLGHESAALTLDRYGHLYPSDVEAVGVAINDLLTVGITRKCVQSVSTDEKSGLSA